MKFIPDNDVKIYPRKLNRASEDVYCGKTDFCHSIKE